MMLAAAARARRALRAAVGGAAAARRCFSSLPLEAECAAAAGSELLEPAALRVEAKEQRGSLPPLESLQFGRTFSDHYLHAEHHQGEGWGAPTISPLQDITLHPGSTVLQYGISCFEGMKAYKDAQGRARLFRPQMNMARLARSAARLALPAFGEDELLECIRELLRVDDAWIPNARGYSLYLRPFIFGSTPFLGVGPSSDTRLMVLLSPVGPYFPKGRSAVSLLIDETNVRAAVGGAGAYKLAGNYAPTISPQKRAAQFGADQCLYAYRGNVSEGGAMNVFFLLENGRAKGGKELVTAPLDGTILPGVTRDSILSLARQWGEFEVSERQLSVVELEQAQREGRIMETFGSGTAAVIIPVHALVRESGERWAMPEVAPEDSIGTRLKHAIEAIQYGEVESPWSMLDD